MWSKNKAKWVRSLEHAKYRKAEGAFIAEGAKAAGDLFGAFHCRYVAATEAFRAAHPDFVGDETDTVTQRELEQTSLLRAPRNVVAVFSLPPAQALAVPGDGELALALDGVQDPGNVGTIVRLCAWFGIRRIYASPTTADFFQPKVVQATMGALAGLRYNVCNLEELIAALPPTCPVLTTELEGNNLYTAPSLPTSGLLVMGSEGRGVSPAVRARATHRLYIPPYAAIDGAACHGESLNVAVATAVVCAELRRRATYK